MAVASRHSYRQRNGAGGKPIGFRSLRMLLCKAVMRRLSLCATPSAEGASGDDTLRHLPHGGTRHCPLRGRAKHQLPGSVPAIDASPACCCRLDSQPSADALHADNWNFSVVKLLGRCALPRKHNCFTKQHPQISEANRLLSSSVLLPIGMTGRNRHSYWQVRGGNAADYSFPLRWMRSGRLTPHSRDVSVRPRT